MYAAIRHPESLKIILESLSDNEKRLLVISEKNNHGQTAWSDADQKTGLQEVILTPFPDYGLEGEQRTLSNLEHMIQLSKNGGY